MTGIVLTPARRTQIRIILPCLPESAGPVERDIYMGFIRALREGPSRRMEVRILTAIHRAADATDNSDAYVSRVLVDLGLMAPRLAFPGDFLDHVDANLYRLRPLASPPPGYIALQAHWQAIGDEMAPEVGSARTAHRAIGEVVTPPGRC
ncbi:MAG: hypothetical protein H6865_00110 [Rhodospirillales bacterium]|nr:hypothetical protein [Alphaproteobacteria bacterium]MCB9986028.1 hypothetical protein [Rhodospirillales bacterium]USO07398.1 MAG: hypothetical protein H6866_08260 [Rhodospirillales bacterium]